MNNIKVLREAAGLTQKALADRVNVTQQAVARWETSEVCPRGELVPLLADVLGCTIDQLYGRAVAQGE